MIDKYNDFILERLINESLIYFTPPIIKVLDILQDDNKIAEDLFNLNGIDVKPDVTFVNLSDREGYFDFSTMKNVQRIVSEFLPMNKLGAGEINDIATKPYIDLINLLWGHDIIQDKKPSSEVFTKSRNPIKIGRLINNLFPGKYTDKEVEVFVNKFKSTVEQTGERFIEVSGDEIGNYYNHNKYKEMSGTLGSSCMARQNKGIFQIYMDNPEVCKMLVLLEEDRIIGRALIWKLKTSDYLLAGTGNSAEYFLDRQYTIKESDVEKFRTYAKEKGWSYKTYNNHTNLEAVTYNGESKSIKMTVNIIKKDYIEFPYVDTFRRYDTKTGILYNDIENDIENIGCYILNSTSGGYEVVSDDVYSDWYDCHIDRDSAVYSRPLQDWIYREDASEVTIGDERRRGWYPDNYDDIVYLEHENGYCHIDNAIWSEYNNEYYLDGTTVETIVRIDNDTAEPEEYNYSIYESFHKKSNDIILVKNLMNKEWFIKLSDKYSDWSTTSAVVKDLLSLDYKKEWILKIFSIETFLVKIEDEIDYFYLTEEDAKLFGYEIETRKVDNIVSSYHTDWFDYYKQIKSYENNISLFRYTPIITLDELFKKVINEDEEIDLSEINSDNSYWEQRNWFIKELMIQK